MKLTLWAMMMLAGMAAAGPLPADVRRAIEEDWARQEKIARHLETTSTQALSGALARAGALVRDLRAQGAAPAVQAAAAALHKIEAERRALKAAGTPAGEPWRRLYLRARWVTRELALASPALDFDRILFVKRNWPKDQHQCSHRVGEAQFPPANLCVLQGLGGDGEIKEILHGEMAAGGIGRPDLSFDARRIVFPHARPRRPATPYGFGIPNLRAGHCYAYDIYEMASDGSDLRQLTDTPGVEDTEPCYLPDGRIAFTSSREGRLVQCGDWALVCGIFSMNPDGSDVRKVTEPQDGEFYPGVLDDGRLIYTRWDYVMKPYNVVQQLWAVNPDGTRSQLAYGDWAAFSRGPIALFEARQIPGTSKVIATGAAHHNSGVGPVMIADLNQSRGGPAGLINVTPEVGYPESNCVRPDERTCKDGETALPMSNIINPTGWYSSPYPLNETQFLACATFEPSVFVVNDFGIYLMDVHGNKDLIYRGEGFSCYAPIPLRPRPRPPVIPDKVRGVDPATPGTLILYDVYQGLEGVKRGTVKYLRVLEAHPKTTNTQPQRVDLGFNSGWDLRSVLGTVPVETDGSAYFQAPSGKLIFFEALDKDHLEVRRMRNYFNLMPGEANSCVGCHESPGLVPSAHASRPALALRRAPSRIEPPSWGTPFMSFPKVIQPILNRHCVTCHNGAAGKPFDLRGATMLRAPQGYDRDEGTQHCVSDAFLNLIQYVHYIRLGGHYGEKMPLKAYATGSGVSRLMQMLGRGHKGVKLKAAEWQALAAWIDCNAPYMGEWSEIVLQAGTTLGNAGVEDTVHAPARGQQLDAR